MDETDRYEAALLVKSRRSAQLYVAGGAAMLVGSVIAFVVLDGGLILYGAFLASFGVMGKGAAELAAANRRQRLHADGGTYEAELDEY